MIKVFVDGQEGTTGLKIHEKLKIRGDVKILSIPEEKRKDAAARKEFINESDVTFLCLPDEAAKESVSLAKKDVIIIDASTAHRVNPGWTYGFSEMDSKQRNKIASSNRISVPGCHATGLIALVRPLVKKGIMPDYYPVVCHSVTGFSGGGKKMIAEYENPDRASEYDCPREYALTQGHKHLPEMQYYSSLKNTPVFTPIVSGFYSGLTVALPIHTELLNKKLTLKRMHDFFSRYYAPYSMVNVMPLNGEGVLKNGFLPANSLSGRDDMQIFVCGNDERMVVFAQYDNLGKGACGAALQCLNIVAGKKDEEYLNLG